MPKLGKLSSKLLRLDARRTQCMSKVTKFSLIGSGPHHSGKLEGALALLTKAASTHLQPSVVRLECRQLADPCPYLGERS